MEKEKKKKVMHAPPRPANRWLVTTCFWCFCPHTHQIRNRSCVYQGWSLKGNLRSRELPVLWTSGGLEQLVFSNCIRPGCILKPPSDSLETSMACADMFVELKLGVTGKRFPIKSLAWHKSQQEVRLSTLQLTQTLSVLSCPADVPMLSSDCLRDPKLDWLIKGSQSSPLHLCARKVH